MPKVAILDKLWGGPPGPLFVHDPSDLGPPVNGKVLLDFHSFPLRAQEIAIPPKKPFWK